MDIIELSPALEAVLFASGEPVPVARLSLVFGVPEEDILVTADKLASTTRRTDAGYVCYASAARCSCAPRLSTPSSSPRYRAPCRAKALAERVGGAGCDCLLPAGDQGVCRAGQGRGQLLHCIQPGRKGPDRAAGRLGRPGAPNAVQDDGGLPARHGHQLPRRAARRCPT